MAGAGLHFTVDDRPVRAALARLAAAGSDLTPLMDAIGGALVADVQRRFEEGAGPEGARWPTSLRARLQGGQTLVDRGRLAGSITHEPGPQSVRVGTNVVYAAIHQFGGTISAKGGGRLAFRLADGSFRRPRSVTIPARPFLGIDALEEDIVAEEVEAWLADVAGPGAKT